MGRDGYAGTGVGEFTPDGCSIELYQRLRPGAEPGIIAAHTPAGGTILELGCGAGRVTHALADLGFAVTAVDESAEMLAVVRGARTVRSSIEDLDLGETFDVVLLGSCLVHVPDPERARGLLAACVRHAGPGGVVLIQREGADWHDDVPRTSSRGDLEVTVVSSTEVRPGVRSVHVEYAYPDAGWSQTFLSRPLTKAAFEELLGENGLGVEAYLTPDETWVRASVMHP
ncbi:class I SAM-dependent methyltransferase [Hamadaea tsunoensis]|uniref:class I SAM-dependent methyltransferase n=1 Tax=Hamadaea tsunoensis TaxID=53368 RepID=UPI00041703C8|nr:class I SAM-dependent methyltransferase [Hamadaea tsunoensis]